MGDSELSKEKIAEYMEHHIHEVVSINKMAGAFGYSPFHFSRMFKKQMKMTVTEFVTRCKLEAAFDEILDGKNILDAALEYGWQSHSGFSKAFKKEYGVSPSFLKAVKLVMNDLEEDSMRDMYAKTVKGNETKEELVFLFKTLFLKEYAGMEDQLLYAIDCAENTYAGMMRYSGDEYITHTIHVALILLEMEADAETILAGLFCDAGKKSESFCVEDLTRLPVKTKEVVRELSNSNLSELELLSESALLVKIAERLHNMRTIEHLKKETWRVKAQETIQYFMPAVRRIGNRGLMEELNALSMRYLS